MSKIGFPMPTAKKQFQILNLVSCIHSFAHYVTHSLDNNSFYCPDSQ